MRVLFRSPSIVSPSFGRGRGGGSSRIISQSPPPSSRRRPGSMNTVYPERTVFMEPRPRGNDEWWRVQWASGRPQFFDLSTRRSEEHTSELQSLMRISYAVFCLKNKISKYTTQLHTLHLHSRRQTNYLHRTCKQH